MDGKLNTIFGWTLFGGVVALGLSSISGQIFDMERPEELGYVIQGVEEEGGAEGPSLAMLLSTADVAKGEAVFAKCIACHTIDQGGPNGIGPNLYGTMGEPIGQGKAGFAFSSALSGHGGTWTFENMDAWLTSPRNFANGTKMSFAGLSNPEDRANIIAYLNTMGSNLPLPAVVEAPADEAAEGEEGAEVAAETEAEVAADATEAAEAEAPAEAAPAE
ncbi:cytochrome c family protein [Croceicoccus sp. Ery5]|uniref:c-type cytochrome n=1 Tax=Croceicoccus sp. Ery5 TaxID=1703340 RepID=UPI001E3B9236|nr:cytochrome c family protein [Croceicoccus sp. Ery5]